MMSKKFGFGMVAMLAASGMIVGCSTVDPGSDGDGGLGDARGGKVGVSVGGGDDGGAGMVMAQGGGGGDSGGGGMVDAGSPKPTCGIAGLPLCKLGEVCQSHGMCESDACNYLGKCIADKSCVAHNGGDTCGAGEVGDPNAQHESCCTSIPLSSGIRLDKYKATSGRMRQMIESTNGNVKGWYLANKATLDPIVVSQIDPFVQYLPSTMRDVNDNYSVVASLGGGIIFDKTQPSLLQGCFQKGTGTHTYWFSDADNAIYGDEPNGYSQDVMDTKVQNCIFYPLAAALCGWDGKKLQTYDENFEAYGNATYPWGETPVAGGFGDIGGGGWGVIGPATLGFDAKACPTCDTTITNWAWTYQFPEINPKYPTDYSGHISAPGRFPRDKGPLGHLDMAADAMEWTSTPANFVDVDGHSPTYKWGAQGSFESHPIDHTTYGFYIEVKYAKTGLRCSSLK